MRKITYILLLFVMMAETAFAQKFTATASKTKVAVGETFQLTFSLNANGTNFKMPALNEFDVYSGPNQSTSMSFVNGAMSQSITLSYIIAAKKEGKVTITPASVIVNGANVQSNSLVIEVVKGGTTTNPNQNSQNQQQNPSSPSNEGIGDNLFVRTSVNKTKAFQGEQITVTHKVYTRYQLRGFQDIKFPDYTGFWSQDVPSNNQQIQVSNENVDGVVYSVAELKKTFIFPQRSGKLQIEPMKVEVVVRKQSNKRPRDIFDQFFGGGYEDATYSVKSKPIIIEVTPLPEANKPANFAGAVGDFSFKAEVNKDKVKANDAINLTVTINGKGNIKLVDPLKINFPEDFETYDAKTKDNISTTASGVSGSKTFDYLAIPRHEGDYKIEPISFSYFDPEKKQYITLPSPEFKIHVDKGKDGDSGANVFNPRSKEDVKVLGNDIRYIKTKNIQLMPRGNYFFGSAAFYLLLIIPFFLFFLFIFIRRKHIEKNNDSVAVKSRKATRMAKKQLVLAEKHLNANNKEQFYVEIFKALHGYTGNKFNIPTANLNKDNIADSMRQREISEATIQQLMSTLDNCEFAHYAPSAASGDLKGIYNNTVELITKIENEIK
ncbi:MAG: BatD family protein [Bacteroidota bacterium]